MARRAFKVDKWVWSDKDFSQMSWHDVIIHGLAASNELISQPDEEPRFKAQELLFDIDYVLNWREAYAERRTDFWISPATLVFADVSDLKADFVSELGGPLLVIYSIVRESRRWTIALDEGQITFESAGFEQYVRREPILKSHYTYLSDSERGTFSFVRGRD